MDVFESWDTNAERVVKPPEPPSWVPIIGDDFKINRLIHVSDGDTVRVGIDIRFYLEYSVDVRLAELDAPEMSVNPVQAAKVAAVSTKWLNQPGKLWLRSKSLDKWRRSLGHIFNEKKETLSGFLVANKLGRFYKGGAKIPWAPAELAIIDAYVI